MGKVKMKESRARSVTIDFQVPVDAMSTRMTRNFQTCSTVLCFEIVVDLLEEGSVLGSLPHQQFLHVTQGGATHSTRRSIHVWPLLQQGHVLLLGLSQLSRQIKI